MRIEWTRKQVELRDYYANFARTEVEPGARQRDADGQFDQNLWDRLAKQGFWKHNVATEYGGDGGSMWDSIAAFEGVASGTSDFGFVLSCVAHAGLMQVLKTDGSTALKKCVLPALMNGKVGATAATELSGGSHVANIRTTARRVTSGYVLNGSKAHITNAPVADYILVVGRIPELGKRDITLFIVPAVAAGLSREPAEDLLGQRSSPTGGFRMDQVSVPESAIVGKEGEGLTTLYSFLAFDRMMYGVAVASALEPHVDRAMEHAQTRQSFGQPLSDHQYIQDKFVRMRTTIEGSRWLSYATVAALEMRDYDAASLRASVAKLVASEGMVDAGLELIQVFGHTGYLRGSGIEQVLRDAVALRLAGGSIEMQKKNIFKQMINEAAAKANAYEPKRKAS